MLAIRSAKDADKEAVLKILMDLDMYYPTLEFKDLFVAEEDGNIVGCAQLEDRKDFFFLGSVATSESQRGKGTASKLLGEILKGLKKEVYLYTAIPDFFSRFGFTEAPMRPELPSKDRYDCAGCGANICICMKRPAK